MFQAMVVCSVMANGTAAVDRTQDDNKKTSQKYESEYKREKLELIEKFEKSGKRPVDFDVQEAIYELCKKWHGRYQEQLKEIGDFWTRYNRQAALLFSDYEPANSDDTNKYEPKYESEYEREKSELIEKFEKKGVPPVNPDVRKAVSELCKKWNGIYKEELKEIIAFWDIYKRQVDLSLSDDDSDDEPANSDDENL
jgi:hypothetical protein